MKKDRLLNKELIAEIAGLGHTEYLVIADCGLPIPKGVKTIDLSVRAGLPGFLDVLDAVREELVIESVILASEIDEKSPGLAAELADRYSFEQTVKVPHEKFKELTKNAKCVVRTGETISYANIILVGGVNF